MKKTLKMFAYTLTTLCVLLLSGVYASAQQAVTDTLPESAYNFQLPKHVVNIYSTFVPYVLFGIIAVGMAYIIYRYLSDNKPAHHDYTHHNLEH